MNAYAERFIGSVRRDCLARIIPLGERHLRHILHQYIEHYHLERNHHALGNNLIDATVADDAVSGRVLRRRRLGGVLNYYFRDAA